MLGSGAVDGCLAAPNAKRLLRANRLARPLCCLLIGTAMLGATLSSPAWSVAPAAATPHSEELASSAPASADSYSTLPLKRDSDETWGGTGPIQVLGSVVLLAVCGGWLWRRQIQLRGSGGSPPGRKWRDVLKDSGWRGLLPAARAGDLRVIQSVALTQRASVHVLEWDGREWLVACTERSFTELGQRRKPAAADGRATVVAEVDE